MANLRKKERPSVHVVHPGGYLQCTTYLVVGAEGAVLVDPGSGSLECEVIEGIRKVGVALEGVAFALLTHCHVDHARGAYRFRDLGVQLVASPRAAQVLQAGGRQVWYEFPDFVIPTDVDLTPTDGERLTLCGMEFRVIHTPGHTDGCASYLVETTEGLAAFTGDLIAGRGHPGWAGSEGFSTSDTLTSLEKLLSASPDKAFRGHGVVGGPAKVWIENALLLGRTGQWELHRERHPDQVPPPFFERRRAASFE